VRSALRLRRSWFEGNALLRRGGPSFVSSFKILKNVRYFRSLNTRAEGFVGVRPLFADPAMIFSCWIVVFAVWVTEPNSPTSVILGKKREEIDPVFKV
jgi:hypothetical protein